MSIEEDFGMDYFRREQVFQELCLLYDEKVFCGLVFYYEEFDIFIDNFLFLLGNFESCSLVMIMIDSLKFIKVLWEMVLDFDKCLKDE